MSNNKRQEGLIGYNLRSEEMYNPFAAKKTSPVKETVMFSNTAAEAHLKALKTHKVRHTVIPAGQLIPIPPDGNTRQVPENFTAVRVTYKNKEQRTRVATEEFKLKNNL